MTALPLLAGEAEQSVPPDESTFSVVLCGTFRRDPAGLRVVLDALKARYSVLSPVGVDFRDHDVEFVRLAHEMDETVDEIERRHLVAMRQADFVWLFCPEGYVGTSAAMEVGFAHAAGIPILTDCQPSDAVVASMVTVVGGIGSAVQFLRPDPGRGLAGLQDYYRRIARRRGWADESARDTLLLLTEEVGELARAVRKASGIRRDGAFPETDVAEEIADMQLYLVHLANVLGVDLADAVTRKEAVNGERHSRRSSAA
jgi:NTP pyrophosphatase (non-canonical NTP hydrolase)